MTASDALARAIIASGGRSLDTDTVAQILGRRAVGPVLGTQIGTEDAPAVPSS